jgi:hypothetical protein
MLLHLYHSVILVIIYEKKFAKGVDKNALCKNQRVLSNGLTQNVNCILLMLCTRFLSKLA